MSDFLLELRSEEIPARMQAGARAELEKLFRREMEAAGVSPGDVTIWSTPRRLALIARGLPDATKAVSEEAKGPPEGAPDQAVEGFCRKNGVTKDQLEVRDVKGRPTYFAVIERPGRAVKELLADAIPAIVRDFSWPKSMRWGAASLSTESLRWVRPLSGIVALLGDEVVECEVHGVASGAATLGHRFHHSGSITIGNADDYAARLRDAHVIVDHEERQDTIRTLANEAARAAELVLVEDEGLVVENAGLTEWPVPLLGRFDRDYLDVPPEVIQLTARVNQKYFVCTSPPAEAGVSGGGAQPTEVPASAGTQELANAFVCTANIEGAGCGAAIVDGNRKVLAARLSDARFFWDVDRKTSLEDHAKKLERITFHEKLGTVADKVERVAKLARWLVEEGGCCSMSPAQAGASGGTAQPTEVPAFAGTQEELADLAEQAARLCKADLVTEMVGEFPELQGLMGGYYARAEGLPDEVADAIRDHYKPVGQGDEVPTAPVTVAVSLADKLDTLVSFFAVNEMPTGSKDPFALRRASLGAISLGLDRLAALEPRRLAEQVIEIWLSTILYEYHPITLTLSGWDLRKGKHDPEGVLAGAYEADLRDGIESLKDYTADFFADRLKVQQREAGVRHDLIDAVFALGGEDDLVRLLARVRALQSFMETEDGANLLAGYKRAANILKKSPLPGGEGSGVGVPASEVSNTHTQPSPSRERAIEKSLSYTPEAAEKALIDALDAAEPKATAAIEGEDFAGAMSALASLRAPIDAFFDEVTVNADEEIKRHSRLDLLARFRAAVHNVADFSRIEG
ncbi:MAG: glycine--tRNA ligase subunit beta [Altererythrobacter sp.]